MDYLEAAFLTFALCTGCLLIFLLERLNGLEEKLVKLEDQSQQTKSDLAQQIDALKIDIQLESAKDGEDRKQAARNHQEILAELKRVRDDTNIATELLKIGMVTHLAADLKQDIKETIRSITNR